MFIAGESCQSRDDPEDPEISKRQDIWQARFPSWFFRL